jgi:hypothetical protein
VNPSIPNPKLPTVGAVVMPSSTGYLAVLHCEKWHHLSDYLTCEEKVVQELRQEMVNGPSDSPKDGFEGKFFA